MANDRRWTKHVGGSEISISDVLIVTAPNESAPCYGCSFFKMDLEGFYCTFPDDCETRECNPCFGGLSTVYKEKQL